MSRRAWARICVAEEALAAAATAACDRCGGLPTKISTAGTTSASMTRCRDHHRRREAEMADRDDQQRHAGDAAEARAVQREADRHATLPVEPEAERVGDHAKAHAGPAEGEHSVGEIKLPGFCDLAERDRGDRRGAGASDEAVARAEFFHGLADEDDDQRAEQIEEGGRARDQRRRPAVLRGAARRDRRSGRRSRMPSRRSRPGSRRRRSASPHSGASFRLSS